MKFTELNLSPALLSALAEAGYEEPTPIQEKAIPVVLRGGDVLGCAQTGTGKTAAFALPILQNLSAAPGGHAIRALVLTPTRELAVQIYENFCLYGKELPLRSCVIYGGVSQIPQQNALEEGVDILVATPGRLIDLMNQKLLTLDQIETFVLDEADRMLDMGFLPDVQRILKTLPSKRQTLLFSATMPPEIAQLAAGMLHEPENIAVTPVSSTVDLVDQRLFYVDKGNKQKLLQFLIRSLPVPQALVFTRTKHGADRVAKALMHEQIPAAAIHGDKSQNRRQQALNDFKNWQIQVLAATDIAARGIDIAELPYVINFDLPNEPETYVHRIGRTGRAGQSGIAISFCDHSEKPYVKPIEQLIGQSIPIDYKNPYPMSDEPPENQRPKTEGGRKPREKSAKAPSKSVENSEKIVKNRGKNADRPWNFPPKNRKKPQKQVGKTPAGRAEKAQKSGTKTPGDAEKGQKAFAAKSSYFGKKGPKTGASGGKNPSQSKKSAPYRGAGTTPHKKG